MAGSKVPALRASLLAVGIAVLLSGCSGEVSSKTTVTPPPKRSASVSERSAVVSDTATPEQVVREFIIAMSEGRAADANALWAGPVKFVSGFDAWTGHRDLVLGEAKPTSQLAVPSDLGTATREATEGSRAKYSDFATISGSMYLLRGDDSLFEPGELRFVFELGHTRDGRWDILGFGSED